MLATLGTVEASHEQSAIAKAAETFNLTPARRDKIVVTRIDTNRDK